MMMAKNMEGKQKRRFEEKNENVSVWRRITRSRRKLMLLDTQAKRDEDILIIQGKLGDYQHHGTGNPLAVRSPETPEDYAVQNLAKIIRSGVLGQSSSSSSSGANNNNTTTNNSSTPGLKTKRGTSGSFWTIRLSLAGQYGWTGLILVKDADSSKPLSVDENILWFLVTNEEERKQLEQFVKNKSSSSDAQINDRWEAVKSRVVTISQLADHARNMP
mmetsp:Transcript_24561/g.44440  ORF Transcript_24561/g.44440 Transcript_24561/m.44440 type:complete len:217 (-) Transcript_24561:568-1218(-)